MKNATKMTQRELIINMNRTIKTLQTTHKNDWFDNERVQIRISRFDQLKDMIVECGYWVLYCSINGLDPNVDGYDLINGDGEL